MQSRVIALFASSGADRAVVAIGIGPVHVVADAAATPTAEKLSVVVIGRDTISTDYLAVAGDTLDITELTDEGNAELNVGTAGAGGIADWLGRPFIEGVPCSVSCACLAGRIGSTRAGGAPVEARSAFVAH